MSICDLRPGERALIEGISGDEKLIKRLLALGCIEGTEVSLKVTAPFGDPLVINLRGFDLAIRKKDAENIFVKSSF
ncbi:ferrous iron transport protein A [Clostridium thailandense]|uniref:Ferrous iron transport protein A n=1 Tax=Clostridium thailandense TaxID=2794346 RepID=A0A949TZ48_9CLOT|nr:FeoA family protein [Clostridium thailandense]MBV7276326.1 ferrous iron transport protein A [Clostridium thailandense]